ncbi:MAG: S-methyl-5'-thioadenosine phosphorylase [candidate division Zixibacteria bacterium]|nr:S-methyl-5'-thioadenosine phosphorylase [candidate division Zixibacteria bacterium]
MSQTSIAVIGGTGFYNMEGLTDIEEVAIDTPFGTPSDAVRIGTLSGRRVAFLARHGRGHRISPAEINTRANFFALKTLGVKWVISVSAVGSLCEEIRPRDFVIPDQLYDHTKVRTNTFFGNGIVAHVGMAEPFCGDLRALLADTAEKTGVTVHRGGTYLCMEGPQFSTKAESHTYRSWGCSVIGMTAAPEAKLAREAEMCYAAIACSTDYDCWHEEHDSVTLEMIIENLHANVEHARQTLRAVVPAIPIDRSCHCHSALAHAILTDRTAIPEETIRRLGPLVSKYLK